MRTGAIRLLHDRDAFWRALRAGELGWRELLGLVAFVVFACGLYGAVLAGWRSPLLSLYVAVKLPMLFLGTIAVVALFNWMTASILGAGLSFRSTVFVVFGSMTVGCWILLSLVPVALFFLSSGVTYAGTDHELHYAHNAILVTHILILATAGVAGNIALFAGLRRVVNPRCPARVLFLLWLTAFAFVGCQLSWILRPFVGSPFYPVAFMRPDCMERNFYEFVFTCVAGSPLSLSQCFTLGCSCLAMVGFLLVGLAPVAWLFAVSTENLPFVVVLTLLIWLIAVFFAARYVNGLKASPLFQRQAGIRMWFVILIVVTLQMATCMRPMLTRPDDGWWTSGKTFFLSHFGTVFEPKKQAPGK